jgi:spore coat protein H
MKKDVRKQMVSISIGFLILSNLCFMGCSEEEPFIDTETEITNEDTDFTPTDWTTSTHSKDADPDFEEVFDSSQVKRFDIVITSERWQSMLDDMTNTYGSFGQPFGQPGDALVEAEDPIFVPAEVFYDGTQWYRVGVRFKGKSLYVVFWDYLNRVRSKPNHVLVEVSLYPMP